MPVRLPTQEKNLSITVKEKRPKNWKAGGR
jgi:hypothetical protein